jgi:hypothetical protein
MLKPSRSHQDYVTFVQCQTHGLTEPSRHLHAKAKLLLLDLRVCESILVGQARCKKNFFVIHSAYKESSCASRKH